MMRLVLLIAGLVATTVNAQVEQQFDGCDVTTYYAGLPADVGSWDRASVQSLLFSTHRNQVNYTNRDSPGVDDIWGALIDVDVGAEPNTVRLIFSDSEISNIPFGERGWIRQFLFPINRGPGILGSDALDIHNIRPATPLSSIVADDKYFGQCQVLTQPETCIAPAEGAAEDTCSCNRIFQPPNATKGDIARALMYMDVRYDGNEPFTLDLRLTDCPFQPERDMAYLSQMLTWHFEDPPDEAEIARNNKVCANWQGNRNPFVDFPQLASVVFPPPSPLPGIGERLIYEKCEALPTQAPTFAANQCDLYNEGDVIIWLLNSEAPFSVGLYSFVPMDEGFELYLTDRPWDGEQFLIQDNITDGTLKFTVPESFEQAGRLFGIGLDGTSQSFEELFEVVEGTFSPGLDGDAIFIYCLSSSGAQRPLTVFSNGGILADAFLTNYTEQESALPDNFPEEGIINLPHYDNLLYRGPGTGELEEDELRIAIRDPANWEGSNEERYGLTTAAAAAGAMTSFHVVTTATLWTVGMAGMMWFMV